MKSIILEGRKNYTNEEIQEIWEKAKIKDSNNSKRLDEYGALMYRDEYGNRDSEFGWEIDHKDENPYNDAKSNLRPLFWRNNLARTADKPHYYHYDSVSKKNVLK